MTGPAAGEPDRGKGAPLGSLGRRDTAAGILWILALGLAFRLIIAYLLPGSGFEVDLASFRFWANDLADNGLYGFYERPFFHDYTPGYLYVLWLVGGVGNALGGVGDLIKIPPVLADLALAWLAWSFVGELGGSRRAARLAAVLVLANPITWFDSVIWGQVDSVGVVFLMLALRELWRDRPERAAVLTVIGALIKPQLGILIPLVAVVTIRRAMRPVGAFGDEEPPTSPRTRWEGAVSGPLRILTTGAAGLLTAVIMALPFGLSLPGLIRQVFSTAGGYPFLSVNAYNPWALLSLDGNGIAENRQWVCDALVVPQGTGQDACSPAFMFGAIPAVAVGAALLVAAFVLVSVAVARRPDRRTILVGLAVLALAFFVLPTRVHERYLFPLVALGAVLAAISTRWRVAYLVSSAATFANMYAVLTTLYPSNPGVRDWLGLGDEFTSWAGVALGALAQLGVLAWSAFQMRRSATRRLASESVGGDDGAVDRDAIEHEASDMAVTGQAGALPAVTRGPSFLAPATPAWTVRPARLGPAELGYVGWFRARLAERPIRPDRSAGLAGESGGRPDRLDAWVAAVLLVSVLSLRIWRLPEPYQMHFDEVYHARTATEFLQAWRYDISHYIYEWTHPHLAKYAMAAGIVAWGGDATSATGDLGMAIDDGAIEPRSDQGLGGGRTGDRIWLVGGGELRAYDLETRAETFRVAIPGAMAVAVDRVAHRVLVGTTDGAILRGPTAIADPGSSDGIGLGRSESPLGAPIEALHATADGLNVLAVLAGDVVVSLEAETLAEIGRLTVPGVAQLADGGTGPAIVARPAEVVDPAAEAGLLAPLMARSEGELEGRLSAAAETVLLGPVPAGDTRAELDAAIAEGNLAGVEVTTVTRVAIAGRDGVTFLVPSLGGIVTVVGVGGPAHGLAVATGLDHDRLYVSYDATDGPRMGKVATGGTVAKDGPTWDGQFELPSRGGRVFYDVATQMVHVLAEPFAGAGGEAPEGAPARYAPTGDVRPATVYVIEPHADAVYADAPIDLPGGEIVAAALDDDQRFPASDRQQLLAFAADGRVATIETGRHGFAWRLPGVIAGALMGVLLYLLARLLFRRRIIGLFVAVLVLADGMLFVQSRIGMNDAYVGLFLLVAYVLFAYLWQRPGKWLAFALLMPVVGISLGLALAAKWVAAYSIGALGILVLARSALGRLLLVGSLIVLTTGLGYIAVSVPEGQGGGNLLFLLLMIGLTLATVAVVVVHPIAWSAAEHRIAVGAPAALGIGVALAGLAVAPDARVSLGAASAGTLEIGFALLLLAALVQLAFVLAGRWGFGPLAPPPEPDDPASLLERPAPPAAGWHDLGSGLGLPALWTAICLVAVPLAVYVVSYLPWAFVEGHRIVEGWPPGHEGQTLAELTGGMYRYHNTLSAAHAASSPWWAWPFDFKPVWFYQESFAGGTAAAIYDSGNLFAWWLGIPAMALATWWAFRRRSLALGLVVIGFACQWLAWSRIDRAAFQYHYYTSLPFVFLAVGYFLAELWHGASRRTWLVARISAGVAVLAPTTLWLLHRPLCGFVRVLDVSPDSRACPTLIPEFLLTARTLAIAATVGIGVLILVRLFVTLGRSDADPAAGGPPGGLRRFGPLVLAGVGVALAFVVARAFFPEIPILRLPNVPVEPIALVATLALLPLAAFVATARDARRFVAGALLAIGGWFVLWYPNLSALPLPAAMMNAYQGLLPTYIYPFQFPVSTVDRSGPPPALFDLGPLILLVALTVTCTILAYSAWVWRVALAERQAEARGQAALGDGRGAAGTSAT